MNRHLSIAGSREGYRPFTTTAATVEEIEDARRIGPFTRAEVLALLWRVKKFNIVAEVSGTGEKEVYNEATEEYEMQATTISASINKSPQVCYNLSEDSSVEGFVPDDKIVPYLMLNVTVDGGQLVFSDPPDGTFEAEGAGIGFYFNSSSEVWKDPDGGHWLDMSMSAGKSASGSSTGGGAVSLRSTDDPLDPAIVDQLHFTGSLVIGGTTVDLRMVATAVGNSEVGVVTAVDSASFEITVEEWRPYATSTGAAAWDTTTGAPANGGPGA